MERFDAIVVGAGPAGGALALLLARAGARVALAERAAIPRDVVCGEFVSDEGVAVLRDLGIESPLSPRLSGARLFTERGEEFSSDAVHGIGWSRRDLDASIVGAAARVGAIVRDRTIVEEPIVEGARVRGVRVHVYDRERTDEWRAPVVVAADGRRSTLARALGLRKLLRAGSDVRFGFRAHLDVEVAAGRTVDLFLFDGGYAGTCAVEANRANLAFVVERRRLREGTLREILDENPVLRERLRSRALPSDLKAVGALEFGRRTLARCGVVFVGDSSGPIDPFMGEGISIALETASLAAPIVLDAIARGGLDAPLARRYAMLYQTEIARRMRVSRGLAWLLRHRLPRDGILTAVRLRPRLFERIVSSTRK
ncbi:MAG: FAD-dependent monooxygenase [Planctomycetes bacterium]|nr:FAD-dependent monooxygenase [Planctomycetota bacterium]MBI3846848.1 FAD-dependent monooxygenase [Planctomycetota bacterium]